MIGSVISLTANADESPLDGYITSADAPQTLLLLEFSKRHQALTPTDIVRLGQSIYSDKKRSSKEFDLLRELSRPDVSYVNMGNEAESYKIPTASPEAAKYLPYLLARKKFDAEVLWAGSPENLAELGVNYHMIPVSQNYIAKAAFADLMGAWKDSSVSNAYEPIRKTLGAKYDVIKGLSEFERAAASLMVYDLMHRIDIYYKDNVPNFIYGFFDDRKFRTLVPYEDRRK